MTLFIIAYHWLVVMQMLGFWSVSFFVSITMCSQTILCLTVLYFLKNLCRCHCGKCGVTLLLLAENRKETPTSKVLSLSKIKRMIPLQLLVVYWQCCDLGECFWEKIQENGKNYLQNEIVQWLPDISRRQRH